jgi:charged multivesicular body protein 4
MFGRLFGTNQPKSKKPPPNLNDSIQLLRKATNQLEKREVHLEKKIQVCLNNAKQKSRKRDKKGALYELKKKKQLEKQLESIQGKKLNLETQIMTLEDAHLNKETLKAMKTSAAVMKSTVKESDLDRADELMEDINEAMDQVAEMNEAMAQPLGQIMDDDELEAELAELEEFEADELLNELSEAAAPVRSAAQTQPALNLPSVPDGDINQPVVDDEDAELAALEAMMN